MDTRTRHDRAWGLTGGIGAGKSFAARILRGLGVPVMDMDLLARKLMEPGTDVFARIATEFGPGVVLADGSLNRRAIAAMVFADPERRRALERIVHPPTISRAFGLLESPPLNQARIVFMESAILFDIGLHEILAGTVLVTAPSEIRIGRVMRRDGTARAEVEARIAAQMDDEARMGLADFVWENSGNQDELRRRIVSMLLIQTGMQQDVC